jgi:gluconate 2-dehydrogenase gamma chain
MTPDLDEPTALTPPDDAPDDPQRRVFVQRLTFMGGGVVLLGSACPETPKPDAGAPLAAAPPRPQALTTSHLTFTNEDFAIVAAAAERVLPKDEDAGALDANVPEYIDRILQTKQLESMKNNFVPGVAALDRRCQRMFKVGFAAANPEQQDEVLTIFKNSPETSGEARWYEMLIVLTLEGFLGDPSYGGNRDEVGWKTVGFTLVDHTKADPAKGYNGMKHLETLRCGTGKGC